MDFDTLSQYLQKFQKSVLQLWNKSKFFRITSIVTGSFFAGLSARNVWIACSRKFHNLPQGFYGIPLIGNGADIINTKWLINASKYGAVTSYMMGPRYGILINDPVLAKQFYKQSIATNMWVFNKSLSSLSFGFLNGSEWKKRRHFLSANLMTIMNSSYIERATIQFIQTKVFPMFDKSITDSKPTAMKPLFRPIAFNIVLQACFGSELNNLKDEFWIKWDKQQKVNNNKVVIQTLLFMMFGSGVFGNSLIKLCTGDTVEQGLNVLIDILDEYSRNKQNQIAIDKHVRKDIKLFEDYLDGGDKSNNTITRRQLLGDIMILFLAATDTTASTLSFAFILAAKYPLVQQELYGEIVNVFGENTDNIELRQMIKKTPKLRAFFHEVLRLFPALPATGNREILDDGVKLGKYNIPIGTFPLINVAAINNDPKYWVRNYDKDKHSGIDMRQIHLEFWLNGEGKYCKNDNFLSFHTGPRNCMGKTLASNVMLIALAAILQKYKVESVDGNTDFEVESMFVAVQEPVIDQIVFKERN